MADEQKRLQALSDEYQGFQTGMLGAESSAEGFMADCVLRIEQPHYGSPEVGESTTREQERPKSTTCYLPQTCKGRRVHSRI